MRSTLFYIIEVDIIESLLALSAVCIHHCSIRIIIYTGVSTVIGRILCLRHLTRAPPPRPQDAVKLSAPRDPPRTSVLRGLVSLLEA